MVEGATRRFPVAAKVGRAGHRGAKAFGVCRGIERAGGGRELSVAEGDTGPPGPIPNPVVKRVSADGYCGSNAVGDVAAAGSSRPRLPDPILAGVSSLGSTASWRDAGWSSGSSSGS
jgi:hypothetical protein